MEEVVLGVVAAPGLPHEVAEELPDVLPGDLAERFGEVRWEVALDGEPLDETDGSVDAFRDLVRERMRSNGWRLGVALTNLPLHSGPRPVTAHANATEGIALLSVPALGAFRVEGRVRKAISRLVDGLLGERIGSWEKGTDDDRRQRRMNGRLRELASPLGEPRLKEEGPSVRFVAAVLRGNLRLLAGMVRANQPWRVVVSLSRASVGAFGTAAYVLISSSLWTLSDQMSTGRMLTASFGAIALTCLTLVIAHRLWERSRQPGSREQVALINMVTLITVALGVASLYAVLFMLALVCGEILIPPDSMKSEIGHPGGLGTMVRLSALAATFGTLGGALGSLVESDSAVRDAMYRSHPDEAAEV
jgi:putative flippase GtrA